MTFWNNGNPRYEPGDRVQILSSGSRGTIYRELPRAAATIKNEQTERESDRTPYSVELDRGGFTFAPGYDLELSEVS